MEPRSVAIQNANQAVARALAERANTIYQAICDCPHEVVGECDYEPSNGWGSASAPERVCLHCGLMEEGWGCGHLVLKNQLVVKLTRQQAFSLRMVRIDNEDQGPLLRREVTLQGLVKHKLGIEAPARANAG